MTAAGIRELEEAFGHHADLPDPHPPTHPASSSFACCGSCLGAALSNATRFADTSK